MDDLYVVIANFGRGQQSLWPRMRDSRNDGSPVFGDPDPSTPSGVAGLYTKEDASAIVADNKSSGYGAPHYHAKPLASAHEFAQGLAGNLIRQAQQNHIRESALTRYGHQDVSYKVGDEILFVDNSGTRHRVEVEFKEDDIKNGRPGFEGKILTRGPEYNRLVWGYDDQVKRVYESWTQKVTDLEASAERLSQKHGMRDIVDSLTGEIYGEDVFEADFVMWLADNPKWRRSTPEELEPYSDPDSEWYVRHREGLDDDVDLWRDINTDLRGPFQSKSKTTEGAVRTVSKGELLQMIREAMSGDWDDNLHPDRRRAQRYHGAKTIARQSRASAPREAKEILNQGGWQSKGWGISGRGLEWSGPAASLMSVTDDQVTEVREALSGIKVTQSGYKRKMTSYNPYEEGKYIGFIVTLPGASKPYQFKWTGSPWVSGEMWGPDIGSGLTPIPSDEIGGSSSGFLSAVKTRVAELTKNLKEGSYDVDAQMADIEASGFGQWSRDLAKALNYEVVDKMPADMSSDDYGGPWDAWRAGVTASDYALSAYSPSLGRPVANDVRENIKIRKSDLAALLTNVINETPVDIEAVVTDNVASANKEIQDLLSQIDAEEDPDKIDQINDRIKDLKSAVKELQSTAVEASGETQVEGVMRKGLVRDVILEAIKELADLKPV